MTIKNKNVCLAILVAVLMLFSLVPVTVVAENVDTTKGYAGEDLPTAPDMTGSIIDVTPENAQYTLDGAYGSIDGKTINFTQGEYDKVLVLARPTKFEGSNTDYYNMTWTKEDGWFVTDDVPDSLQDLNSNITTYKRIVENVIFTSDEGVSLAGFSASSGHVYSTDTASAYDYVRDKEILNTSNSYYGHNSLINITFKGLNIKGGVFVSDYSEDAVNNEIVFDGCTFTGSQDDMNINGFNGIKMSADSKYFGNITVKNCSFTNYFQAIYIQGVSGAVISNNYINGTAHNAIALQSSKSNGLKGSVVVTENFIENTKDRAIRVGDATAEFKLNVENNVMVNSGDLGGELFKAQTLPEGSEVSLENNYWDGRTVESAVANEEVRPESTGITGGTFSKEIIDDYCAEGFFAIKRDDGTFGACDHSQTEIKDAKEATCQTEGYSGDKVCVNCGEILEKGEIIAKSAHHYVDGICTVCGDTEDKTSSDGNDEQNNSQDENNEAGGNEDNENNYDSDVPQNGDNSHIVLWVIMFIIAGSVLIAIQITKKYKRRANIKK